MKRYQKTRMAGRGQDTDAYIALHSSPMLPEIRHIAQQVISDATFLCSPAPTMLSIFLLIFSIVLRICAASRSPTVVLIPDAWHSPIHYVMLLAEIESAGYATSSARCPSCDSTDPYAQTVTTDASSIRQTLLLPLINKGRDIVLIMHSYGGCPGAMAAKGLSKAELQASGRPGGIIGLVFICAFVAHEGQSLLSSLPGERLGPWAVDYVSRSLHSSESYRVSGNGLICALFRGMVNWAFEMPKTYFTMMSRLSWPHGPSSNSETSHRMRWKAPVDHQLGLTPCTTVDAHTRFVPWMSSSHQ